MNIGIVTVYNTENCGSFLQAYALFQVLEKLGHQVYFLHRDITQTAHSFKAHIRETIIKCLKLDFVTAQYVWKRYNNYKCAQKSLPIMKETEKAFSKIDCVILGSDTIWNFSSEYFKIHKDIYTGEHFRGKRCITYAVSAGNTPVEVFKKDKTFKINIEKLDAISVRDLHTQKIVEKLTGKRPEVVCDPTILVDRSLLDKLAPEIFEKEYILLYHFGKIFNKVKEDILQLKKKRNYQVISFGEYRSWCDKNIAYDPFLFIAYMRSASLVITDTFHGTIFSILYEHNFAEYGGEKKKIENLLDFVGLKEAIVHENDSLVQVLEEKLDYSKARRRMEALRSSSIEFLKKNLMES